jgi:hypothetical protein
MAYFDRFPLLLYSFDGKSLNTLTDILARIQVKNNIKDNALLYKTYQVSDGETPEIVADKIYGSTGLHWVILLTNDIVDPRNDWYIDSVVFESYLATKYTNPDQTRHHELLSGLVVDSDYPSALPISHRIWEDRINNKKRFIKILTPELLPMFIEEFQKLL